MIYTVTFNPSLDYVVQMDHLDIGDINRAEAETIYPGGKGINVALVLDNLGIPAKMLGFMAGFTGREIERLAKEHGGDCDFITLEEGYSRINMKISAIEETAVNGLGPHIPPEKLQQLVGQIDGLCPGDVLVLAGSIPADIPTDIYEQLLQRLAGKSVRTVVDATGELLLKVLKYHPFFVKPNQFELGELFGRELATEEEIISCAQRVQALGAQNVLVSLGGDGALLVAADGQVYRQASPQGKLVNSVGAGDSLVAGFLAGYAGSQGNLQEALRLGVCAGSASAFHPWLATKKEIEEVANSLL